MDFFQLAKEGGGYIAPLLVAAVIWQERERLRLLAENKELSGKVEGLAERVVTLATRIDQFLERLLFNERKA